MGKLRKRQHEDFCVSYAEYPNAGDAANAAGYAFANRYSQGYRLLRRPHIQRRIAELREQMVARECLGLTALLAKLESSFVDARKHNNANACVRVIEVMAKLSGHLTSTGARAHARDSSTDDTNAATDDSPAGPPKETIVADATRFASLSSSTPSQETTRAALAAVARSSARKRARASA